MGIAEAACTALALLAPVAADDAAAPGATASVVLRWAPVAGATAYDVQIAPDPGFASLAAEERVPGTTYRWRRTPTRPFLWRVRSVDSAGRPGAWSGVRPIAPAVGPPRLRAPAEGARAAAGRVDLSCEPSPLLRSYAVEVARDPAFAQRVLEATAPSCAFRVALPESDRYHWRVRGLTAHGDATPPSPSRALDVLPAAPELLAPPAGEVVPYAPVLLRWSAVPGAKEYRVAVDAPGGPRVWNVRETEVRLVPERPGVHGWTVTALGAAGLAGPAAAARTVEFDLVAPALESPPDGEVRRTDGAAKIELAWAPVPQAAAYAVEIVRDGSEEVVSRAAAGGPMQVELAPGTYRWTVAARTASGRLGPRSQARTLAVELLPPPPPESPPPPIPVVERPPEPALPSALRAGIAAAWRTNFGRLSRPGPSLEIAARRPFAAGWIGLSLRAAWFEASATVPASDVLPAPVEASARLFPVALLATIERPRGRYSVYAAAGATAWIARVESGPEAIVRVAPGAEALVGAARPLRSGEAFLEVGGALGELSTRLVRMRTGGVFASAGWRVDL